MLIFRFNWDNEEFYSSFELCQMNHEAKDRNYFKDQDFDSILKKGELFVDPYFPPVITSLVPANKRDPVVIKTPESYVRDYMTYGFSRPHEIYGKNSYCVFSEYSDVGTQDIVQGSMASCYLIVTLANMCRYPKRIYDLYVSNEVNKCGLYGMNVYIQGEPVIVVIDDNFPSKNNKFTFSQTTKPENEIWVHICEKVWGKVNQCCYLRTFLGTPQEAMYFLCPSPAYYVYHKTYTNHPHLLWNIIKSSFDAKYIICTNTEEIDESNGNGLFKFHAYALLDLFEYNEVKLLKLRNPWGDKRWKGKYGDIESKEWTSDMRIAANANDLQSGSFYIEISDYVKYFPWSFYSKYNESYHYKYLKYQINVEVSETNQICRTILDSKTSMNENDIFKNKVNRVGNHSHYYYDNQLNVENVSLNNSKILTLNSNTNKLKKETDKKIDGKNDKNNNGKLSKLEQRIINNNISKNTDKIKPEFNFTRQETSNFINLKELQNYKITEEMLEHGDNKIFDIINKNVAAAFIRVNKECKSCITLHQPQKRFIADVQDSFEVPCATVFIFKYQNATKKDDYFKIESKYDYLKRIKIQEYVNKGKFEIDRNYDGKYKLVSSHFCNFEKAYIEIDFSNLGLGEYHILCLSQFENFDNKFNLLISTYTDKCELDLYYLKRHDIPYNWLLYCLKELAISSKNYSYFEKLEPESYYISFHNHKQNTTGFGILYYENNSKDTDLIVKISLNKHDSFRILNCRRFNKETENERKYYLHIKPCSYKCLLLQFIKIMPFVDVKAKHEVYFDWKAKRVEEIYNSNSIVIKEVDNKQLKFIQYNRGYMIYFSGQPINSKESMYVITIKIKNFISDLKIVDIDNLRIDFDKNVKEVKNNSNKSSLNEDISEIIEIAEFEEQKKKKYKQKEVTSKELVMNYIIVKDPSNFVLNQKFKKYNSFTIVSEFYFHLKSKFGLISPNSKLEYEVFLEKVINL